MKNYDLMSYQELKAALHTIQGELGRIKTSDVLTKRLQERKRDLISQIETIQGLIVLAKQDEKTCKELSFKITEEILKAYGVYSSRLHEDIATRLIARNVDIFFPKEASPETFTLARIKSLYVFRKWLRYKLELLAIRAGNK